MRKLLFIDTNIWLDFYRARNDAAVKLLKHVEALKQDVIVTYQVESEFKNNRQRVIAETHNALKIDTNVGRPAIFADAQASSQITKGLEKAKKGVAQLKGKLGKLLDDPTRHDTVYQICQRVFHREDAIVLKRDNPKRRTLRHKARTRFMHGLPPRKKSDTSMGDAFNWEWIIECATTQTAEVVIVSRDADYGITFNGRSYVNDHLRHEFSERVSKKRGLYLYDSLSTALKEHFSINVSKEEETAEKEIAKTTTSDKAIDLQALLARLEAMRVRTEFDLPNGGEFDFEIDASERPDGDEDALSNGEDIEH